MRKRESVLKQRQRESIRWRFAQRLHFKRANHYSPTCVYCIVWKKKKIITIQWHPFPRAVRCERSRHRIGLKKFHVSVYRIPGGWGEKNRKGNSEAERDRGKLVWLIPLLASVLRSAGAAVFRSLAWLVTGREAGGFVAHPASAFTYTPSYPRVLWSYRVCIRPLVTAGGLRGRANIWI